MGEQLWPPVAGKYGRTRDGRKVGPLSFRTTCTPFCWQAIDEYGAAHAWDEIGRFRTDGVDSPEDLVSSWSETDQYFAPVQPQIFTPFKPRARDIKVEAVGDPATAQPIDFSKIRIGDEVEIRRKVVGVRKHLSAVEVSFDFVGGVPRYYSAGLDIVRHIPAARPIETGDKVSFDGRVWDVFEIRIVRDNRRAILVEEMTGDIAIPLLYQCERIA